MHRFNDHTTQCLCTTHVLLVQLTVSSQECVTCIETRDCLLVSCLRFRLRSHELSIQFIDLPLKAGDFATVDDRLAGQAP
jgi:hypothetical protein